MSAEIIQHTAEHHLSVPSTYANKNLVTRHCDPVLTPCGITPQQNNFINEESTFARSSASLNKTTNSTTTYITSPKLSTYPPLTLPGLVICYLYLHCH